MRNFETPLSWSEQHLDTGCEDRSGWAKRRSRWLRLIGGTLTIFATVCVDGAQESQEREIDKVRNFPFALGTPAHFAWSAENLEGQMGRTSSSSLDCVGIVRIVGG